MTNEEFYKEVRDKFEKRLRERGNWEPGYIRDEILNMFDRAIAETSLLANWTYS